MNTFGISISQYGELMGMARRASHLACNSVKKQFSNTLSLSIALYTDDPSTAGMFYSSDDMADICGVSQIECVAIVMGEDFPPSSFEAERPDGEWPRVAALAFKAQGDKCPRCRKVTVTSNVDDLCNRCNEVVGI